jgi:hypothetical protein
MLNNVITLRIFNVSNYIYKWFGVYLLFFVVLAVL